MDLASVVTRDPDVLGGTSVFTGTRVPVQSLIQHLQAGDSLDDFLMGFPGVKLGQAVAFLQLAFRAAIDQHQADRSG